MIKTIDMYERIHLTITIIGAYIALEISGNNLLAALSVILVSFLHDVYMVVTQQNVKD